MAEITAEMIGHVPSELGNLTELTNLGLGENSFSGLYCLGIDTSIHTYVI